MTDSAQVRVRITPRAARVAVGPRRADGVLLVRVTAPPVDGKANAALERAIADALGIAPSRVAVVRGLTAREKVLRIDGMEQEEVDRTLS